MVEYEIPFVCLIFTTMISIIFFTKKKVELEENFYFRNVLIFTLLVNITNFISHYGASIYLVDTVNCWYTEVFATINKIGSWFIVIISFNVMSYIFYISFEKYRKKFLRNKYINNIIFIIIGILIAILDFKVIKKGTITSGEGTAVILTFVLVFLNLITAFVVSLFNVKKYDKRYNSIYIIIPLILLLGVFVMFHPEFNIYDLILCLLCYLMYFTIENPDVKMLEQVDLAREHAEKANAAKTDFLSNMSHEIRTPLNAIVGFSEAINEEKDLDSAKNDAKDIILAANNLLEIVNGILDISKIEANKMEIVEKDYNPTELFENIAKLIAPRIGEKPIELNIDIAKDLPPCLYGDSGKVKQITTNILTNAVKYTEKGSINYSVSCVNLKNESSLVISVEDTGRGIKPEQIDKLFTKFERLEEDRNTTLEGTGLGLAITKKLVEMMGGKIVVQSVYGSGSKFTVYLKQKINHRLQHPNYQKDKEANLIKDFTGNRVLVVDDNVLNLKVAERLLKNYNLDIIQAKSGFECIDMIANKQEFDLILMDDMMPKMTGTETFKKLKDDITFKIPVVILTANAIEGMKTKYIEKGFDDYLSKPIEKPELERVLNKFLSKKEGIKQPENTLSQEPKITEPTESNDINLNTKEYLESQGIDVDHGIELLGDIEMYNTIMEDFIKEMSVRLPKLQEFKDKSDMPNYAILVHAIKSDCKYLGIMDLAEHNYQHELKSKENDIKFVNSDYNNLIEDINKYLEICKKYLNK